MANSGKSGEHGGELVWVGYGDIILGGEFLVVEKDEK